MERLTTHDYVAGVRVGDLKVGISPEKAYDRLAMYEEMHEIYVKHTGDTVYYIGQGECWDCIFGLVGFTEDGGMDFVLIDSEGEGINCDYSEWGKTVFPTQEEAKAALSKA